MRKNQIVFVHPNVDELWEQVNHGYEHEPNPIPAINVADYDMRTIISDWENSIVIEHKAEHYTVLVVGVNDCNRELTIKVAEKLEKWLRKNGYNADVYCQFSDSEYGTDISTPKAERKGDRMRAS